MSRVSENFGSITAIDRDELENGDATNSEHKENIQLNGVGLGSTNDEFAKQDMLPKEKLFGLVATAQVELSRETYGSNEFAEMPMKGFWRLFWDSFDDTILRVLIVAAIVSLGVGAYDDPEKGWIDGIAILVAVLIVALVTATNDYNKELQFRALEKTSEAADRVLVLREGDTSLLSPPELVVGDVIVLKAGDGIPADGLLFAGEGVKSNESGLTGEPDDLTKKHDADCFLYSSCTLTEVAQSADCRMMVYGVGENSQWGKIRATLVTDPTETPLQLKLDNMAKLIGYVGVFFAIATFITLVAMVWARPEEDEWWVHELVEAFIVGVTIIVVAIPEGLPLAVTISLAYSTQKMYKDNNLIRVLAACETMGNATNICSDKTGTLTENQMTAVEGWFCDQIVRGAGLKSASTFSPSTLELISQNIAINRSCQVRFHDEEGNVLHKPKVIGSATEGALVILAAEWGVNSSDAKEALFRKGRDLEYPFNSSKKRSSVLITRDNFTLRLYSKGASETILADCQRYSTPEGDIMPMTPQKRRELEGIISRMADGALRTLCLAHVDYATVKELPPDYLEKSPDSDNMILDAIVGIMDPLRSDVMDAVRTAQEAGVMVRMVTGDNINTAKAIAKACGIYDPEFGLALEGPKFRAMTPAQLDEVLPRLQVLARSSPNDKYLLVTRLNGHGIPDGEKEWLELHDKDSSLGLSWRMHKDELLPGYKEEWSGSRKGGHGEVVGVTGDGTNDAPALKAADVGLSMGITGTKVAQNASDIVILDDKFSSIVRAIMWGRGVYDNIRKFLQFQLTVNVVALLLVLIGALAAMDPPLNPLMMLWVNLIMDTMGALALGTEEPTMELLKRRPYRRDARLISWPMMRNILCQSGFQLILLVWLLFDIKTLFSGVRSDNACKEWSVTDYDGLINDLPCSAWDCDTVDQYDCYQDFFDEHGFDHHSRDEFEDKCLDCESYDYTHYSILFNAFVFCQIFNEFNARSIFDDWRVLKGLEKNWLFMTIIVITVGLQIVIIELGGEFTKTTSLSVRQWWISSALGAIALPVGFLMRFIPIKEDPASFSGYATPAEQELLAPAHLMA